VQSKERLRDFEFVDPAEDFAWIVLRASGKLVPITAVITGGEMRVLEDVAAIWNKRLGLEAAQIVE
jgi:hypothetical protein